MRQIEFFAYTGMLSSSSRDGGGGGGGAFGKGGCAEQKEEESSARRTCKIQATTPVGTGFTDELEGALAIVAHHDGVGCLPFH